MPLIISGMTRKDIEFSLGKYLARWTLTQKNQDHELSQLIEHYYEPYGLTLTFDERTETGYLWSEDHNIATYCLDSDTSNTPDAEQWDKVLTRMEQKT